MNTISIWDPLGHLMWIFTFNFFLLCGKNVVCPASIYIPYTVNKNLKNVCFFLIMTPFSFVHSNHGQGYQRCFVVAHPIFVVFLFYGHVVVTWKFEFDQQQLFVM